MQWLQLSEVCREGLGAGLVGGFKCTLDRQQLLPAVAEKNEKKEMRRAQKQNKILKRNSPISAGRPCRPPLHAWPHARRAFCLLCCSCSSCAWGEERGTREIACLFVCLFCCPCISIAFELCRRVIENLSSQNRRALQWQMFQSAKARNCKKPAAASCGASYTSWATPRHGALLLFVRQRLLAANTCNRMQFVGPAHGTC